MKPTSLDILDSQTYFREIISRIHGAKSGSHIALMSMSYNPSDPAIASLMDELIAAASRGAKVQLNVDAHSFVLDDSRHLPTGPLVRSKDIRRSKRLDFQAKFAALDNLAAAGGHYSIMNLPKRPILNPFAGRSHMKYTVINDILYIGGCNLSDTHQTDMMIRVKDSTASAWAYNFMLEAASDGNVRRFMHGNDFRLPFDNTTSLLVDAGVKKQSLIYDEALKMIDSADKWIVMTCAFFPGDSTSAHLASAVRRGIDVHLYYNHVRHQGVLRLAHQIAEWREKIRCPGELFLYELPKAMPRIHAKLLATDHGAMVGSHNYVTQGVSFGTAESSLISKDPSFAQKAVDQLMQQINL